MPAESEDPGSNLIAKVPLYGVCSGDLFYGSKDGGLTWEKLDIDRHTELSQASPISGDCNQSCQFPDTYNQQIDYRILAGNTLLRSLDQGATWQEAIKIPDWNQMEKNYVYYYFGIENLKTVDARGPFHAVTDPKTGNIVLAMGIEGVLILSPDGRLSWIKVDQYRQVNPTRQEMLKLIKDEEWARAPLIVFVVMLVGLRRMGADRFRTASLITILTSFGLILIPFIHEAKNTGWGLILMLMLMIILMLITIAVNLKLALSINRKKVIITTGLAILAGLVYILSFIAWSQGWTALISRYLDAAVTGLAFFFITILAVILRRKPEADKPILVPSPGDPPHASIQ